MKLLSFFLLLLSLLPSHADPAKWEKEIAAIEASTAKAAPAKGGIVFIGSSSIRLWKTLREDFPNHPVVNHGFGGSQIEDSTHFAERLIFPFEPRLIVIYAGGNDLNAGKTPDQVVADYEAFVAKVRTKLPDVRIAYISIAGNPARWKQVDKVREVNRRIEAIAKVGKNLQFINVFDAMMGPDGLPKPEIFVADRLHMNAAGYAIWKEVVGPYLDTK